MTRVTVLSCVRTRVTVSSCVVTMRVTVSSCVRTRVTVSSCMVTRDTCDSVILLFQTSATTSRCRRRTTCVTPTASPPAPTVPRPLPASHLVSAPSPVSLPRHQCSYLSIKVTLSAATSLLRSPSVQLPLY